MSLCSWTQKEERQKGRERSYWSNSKTSQNVTMWEGQDVRRGKKAKRYRIVSLRGREEMEDTWMRWRGTLWCTNQQP